MRRVTCHVPPSTPHHPPPLDWQGRGVGGGGPAGAREQPRQGVGRPADLPQHQQFGPLASTVGALALHLKKGHMVGIQRQKVAQESNLCGAIALSENISVIYFHLICIIYYHHELSIITMYYLLSQFTDKADGI